MSETKDLTIVVKAAAILNGETQLYYTQDILELPKATSRVISI